MFHIVFDTRGAEILSEAMDLDEALDGEIILISEDYSIGPIQHLYAAEGLEIRKQWTSRIHSHDSLMPSFSSSDEDSDFVVLQRIIRRMEEEEFDQIWIWVAPNAKDVCGYYWLIMQLKLFPGRIYIISLNNLPFINEKGNVFYPVSLSEIPVREYIKAKKLSRPISGAEFETDPDEWTRLAADNKNIRLLEGGKKLIQESDEFFDHVLLSFLQPGFQKIQRLLQQISIKYTGKFSELFIQWRLNELISAGIVEKHGEAVRLFVKVVDKVNG